jgi:hypothetical protein
MTVVRWVFGILPAFISYTDELPQNVGGRRWLGPCIRIRPRYRDDEGIHQHEIEHVRQWYASFMLPHALLYPLVDRYRLWAEVRAYRKQLACYPDDRAPLFAAFIATHYSLKISESDALTLLRAR